MVAHGAWDDPDENTIKSIKVISSSSAVTLQTVKHHEATSTTKHDCIYIYAKPNSEA
jgi:hypothetical protein